MAENLIIHTAVSYTHLDVYKRQGVDEEGPHCANGRVEYASGTKQNLDAMVKAGLNGMTCLLYTSRCV